MQLPFLEANGPLPGAAPVVSSAVVSIASDSKSSAVAAENPILNPVKGEKGKGEKETKPKKGKVSNGSVGQR